MCSNSCHVFRPFGREVRGKVASAELWVKMGGWLCQLKALRPPSTEGGERGLPAGGLPLDVHVCAYS